MCIRVGIIGAGQIGEDHVRRITEKISGARVTAVASRRRAPAEKVAEICGARVENNIKDLLPADDVDAVILASPSELHEKHVLLALAAGKPVFCEKPLAVTAEGCKRIIEAEVKLGRRMVQVGFMRRYDHGYRQLKQAIASRAFGAPLMVHCAHRNIAPHGHFTTDMSVTQTAIHEIDVTRWLLDDDYVSAQVIFPRHTANADAGILRDPQLMILTTRRGVCINLEVYVNCKFGYDIQCEVVCENGVIRMPDPSGLLVRAEAKRYTALETDWVLRFIDAYDVELKEWVEDVESGRLRGPSSWDGYAAALTADALLRAQKTGRVEPVELEKCPEIYRK